MVWVGLDYPWSMCFGSDQSSSVPRICLAHMRCSVKNERMEEKDVGWLATGLFQGWICDLNSRTFSRMTRNVVSSLSQT